MIRPVVEPGEIAERTLGDRIVFADVRWYLDGRLGWDAFQAGHLPWAVFVDLDRDLAAPGHPAEHGRHPFNTPDDFAAAMSRCGISNDSVVVAYDDTGGMTAARLVVMLRMQGCQAAVLNGGIDGFASQLEVGPGSAMKPGDFQPQDWPQTGFATADELSSLEHSAHLVAIDARSSERYGGLAVAVDPRPGHIPGATSSPWTDAIEGSTKRFRSADALRTQFESLGVTPDSDVVNYCGSGVSACVNVIALEIAGFGPSRLYVPSWSGWSSDPQRPAKLGGER